MKPIAAAISRYFQLEQFGTTISTEIIAGLSTYLSLAYIFIVNPSILSQAGIEPTSALFATAMVASLATLAMGLWANLPFAVAPGLTMNSYFVFVVCQKMHFTWQQALATVCVSGLLCVLLTALPLRQAIIDSIPAGLKRAITVTLGVFVATIGLFIAKVVGFGTSGMMDVKALDMAHLTSPLACVLWLGLTVSALLGMKRLRFPAGMLVAIVLSAMLYHHLIPDASAPAAGGGNVLASFGQLDFSVFFHQQFWLPVIVFFVLDFFEGIGEFIGMTSNTSIQDKDGNVPNIKQGLWVDGMGTVAGSIVGTSSLIVFVESAVGIKAGGRTGLTAVVCSLLMMLGVAASFYFAPVLSLVPAQAASGVLVYVGYLILSSSVGSKRTRSNSAAVAHHKSSSNSAAVARHKSSSNSAAVARHKSSSNSAAVAHNDGENGLDTAIALIMGAIAFLTFSLDKSLAFGLWAYFLISIKPGFKPSWFLGAVATALTAAIVLG